jgi:hypothetical protein
MPRVNGGNVAGMMKLITQKIEDGGLSANLHFLDGRIVCGNPSIEMLEALRQRGKEYVAIPRPKGFRHQKEMKECFYNAYTTAMKRREARYVEGLAFAPNGTWLPHAWLTTDGIHAIDQTWNYQEGIRYFGIQFPIKEVASVAARRGWVGAVLDNWRCGA